MHNDISQYETDDNIHGDCDLCRMDAELSELLETYYLCPGCLDTVDARTDSRLLHRGDDDLEAALREVLNDHLGSTIILHYPVGGSGEESHTKTVENVEHFEIEWGDPNTVRVSFATDKSQTEYSGVGLTVSGMTL